MQNNREPGGETLLKPQLSLDELCGMLHKMTRAISNPTILGLDGSWGTGKTFLLKMWRRKLAEEKRPFVYFNAWENDHGESPFIGLNWAMQHQLPEKIRETAVWHKTNAIAKALSNTFGCFDLSIPMSLAAFGGLGLAASPMPLIKEEESACAAPDNKIDAYNVKQEGLRAFRLNFAELADQIGKLWMAEHPESHDQPPLIIFIDNLEQCHPEFIDQTFEMAKSIFDLDHILFVFAVSTDQVRERLKSIYGSGLDTEAYLWRIFDHIIPMPISENNQGLVFCRHLLNRLRVNSNPLSAVGSKDLAEEFFRIVIKLNMSLLEQHQAAVISDLIAKAYGESHWAFICCLVCLKMKYPKAFEGFRTRSFKFINLQDIIHWDKDARQDPVMLAREKFLGHVFGALLQYCHSEEDWPATRHEIVRYAKNHEPIGLSFYKELATADAAYQEEIKTIMVYTAGIMK